MRIIHDLSTGAVFGLLFLLLLYFTQISFYSPLTYAQTSGWTSDSAVNTEVVVSDQYNHDVLEVVADDSGGVFILYSEHYNGGDMLVQRLNGDGTVAWDMPIFLGELLEHARPPQMISDDVGGVIVVWPEWRSTVTQVYAQRIDMNGTILWDQGGLLVSLNSLLHGRRPQVVSDGSSGAIVSWGYVGSSTREFVTVQRISSHGALMWNTDGVTLSQYRQGSVDTKIASDRNGGAFVLYRDQGTVPLWLDRVNNNGSLSWIDRVQLSDAGVEGNTHSFQLVSDHSGNAIVTWRQVINGSTHNVIEVVSSTGDKLLDGPFTLFLHPGNIVRAGEELFVINNIRVDPWDVDIYTSTLTYENGLLLQSDLKPVLIKEGFQNLTDIVEDGFGGLVLVWTDRNITPERQNEDDPNEQVGYDIYAQRVNADRDILWGAGGIVVSNALSTQTGALIDRVSDDFVVVWTDIRNRISHADVYAQRINLDGTLGPGITPTPTATPTSTPPPGWELPIGYEGRGSAATSEQFKRAFWEHSHAYFDHYREWKSFASFVGELFTKYIHVSADHPDACNPKDRCYDDHKGHDMTGDGTAVYSVDDGTIVYTSKHNEQTNTCTESENSYGCIVIAEYFPEKADGLVYTFYAHLSEIDVETGQAVTRISKIGTQGVTGCVGCGTHLHLSTMQQIELDASSNIKPSKKSLKGKMSSAEWKGLVLELPPIDRPLTDKEIAKHYKNILVTDNYGGAVKKTYGRCTYTSPGPDSRTFTFIDPFGWRGEGTDPWSRPVEKAKDHNKDGEKEKNNNSTGIKKEMKETEKILGCNINSPYLWKYDVGTFAE